MKRAVKQQIRREHRLSQMVGMAERFDPLIAVGSEVLCSHFPMWAISVAAVCRVGAYGSI